MMSALVGILFSNLLAPLMAIDPPKLHGLRITIVKRYPREMTDHYYDYSNLREPAELPERLVIQGVSTRKYGGRFTIGIDLEQHVVVVADWSTLTADDYMGSAAIGIILFGLPGLLLTAPIWLTTQGLYRVLRLITGMDQHSFAIYCKLRGQLEGNASHLRRALQNHNNGVEEHYMELSRGEYEAKMHAARIANLFENWKDDDTFMHQLMIGCAEHEDIMYEIKDWKNRDPRDQHVQLHEWLGMTEDELKSWEGQKKTLEQIVEARRAAGNIVG